MKLFFNLFCFIVSENLWFIDVIEWKGWFNFDLKSEEVFVFVVVFIWYNEKWRFGVYSVLVILRNGEN